MCGMELLLTPQVHTFMILHLRPPLPNFAPPPPNLGIINVLTQGGRWPPIIGKLRFQGGAQKRRAIS